MKNITNFPPKKCHSLGQVLATPANRAPVSKGKNSHPRSQLLPCGVDPFMNQLQVQETKQEVTKFASPSKNVENQPSVSVSLTVSMVKFPSIYLRLIKDLVSMVKKMNFPQAFFIKVKILNQTVKCDDNLRYKIPLPLLE